MFFSLICLPFFLGLFAITERREVDDNKVQEKWVKCPTCRQHTDVGNIAYVDDRQSGSCNYSSQNTNQACEKSEASLTVQGSYGTKVGLPLSSWHNLKCIAIIHAGI